MKATFFSALLALAFFFLPLKEEASLGMMIILIAIPLVLMASVPVAFSAAWTPLQKGEQNITPRLIEMFSFDRQIRRAVNGLLIFPLLSIAVYLIAFHTDWINPVHLFLGWVVLLGVALDLTYLFFTRITAYFDPFRAAELFTKEAKEHIRLGELDHLVDSIEALSEVSLRAIERSNTSLASQGIVELKEVGKGFLKSAKSFTHLSEGLQTEGASRLDKVSYILFFLLGRLEMIGNKATKRSFEPQTSQTLSAFGSLAIASAAYDMTLAPSPLVALGREALLALNHGFKETGVKAQIILLEVAKSLVKDIDLSYQEIKTPFFTLIDNLDKISKELFKLDKTVPIKILTQPFEQLRELFADPKLAGHQDLPALIAEVDRVLAEYAALESVMTTRPTLPPLT